MRFVIWQVHDLQMAKDRAPCRSAGYMPRLPGNLFHSDDEMSGFYTCFAQLPAQGFPIIIGPKNWMGENTPLPSTRNVQKNQSSRHRHTQVYLFPVQCAFLNPTEKANGCTGPGYLASQIWFDIIKETCWQRVQYRAHRDSLLGVAHNIFAGYPSSETRGPTQPGIVSIGDRLAPRSRKRKGAPLPLVSANFKANWRQSCILGDRWFRLVAAWAGGIVSSNSVHVTWMSAALPIWTLRFASWEREKNPT